MCMIIKNEEENILKYFEKNMSYFDLFCIVDTGSTDNTLTILKNLISKNNFNGNIYERKWVDFSYNRNECLEYSRNMAPWSYMIDCDDNIEGEKFCNLDDSLSGYLIKIKTGNVTQISNLKESYITYSRYHLFNNNYVWKYKGVVHEYAYCNVMNGKLYESNYMIVRTEGCRSKDPNKYMNDALLLENELLKKECNKGRTLFYLAQSYRDFGNKEKAIYYYLLRSEFNGWIQETYMAFVNLIILMNDINEKIKYCKKAQKILNTRCDAVYILLKYARINNIFNEEIFELGNAYIDLKLDPTNLFVNNDAYNWSYCDELSIICYYTNRFELCKKLCEKIINICPANRIDRIQKNIDICNNKLATIENLYNNKLDIISS